MANADLRRGDLFWVDWTPGRGSEQTGRRPALILQQDAANSNERYPNTIVATVSTKGRSVPFHVEIVPSTANGLRSVSYVKCEQVMTISKERLEGCIGSLSTEDMRQVATGLCAVLDLP